MRFSYRPSSPLFLSAVLFAAFFIVFADYSPALSGDVQVPVRDELKSMFAHAGCEYPPTELTMIALKRERRLEVWALDSECEPTLVADYPIYGASGTSGPKLEQGDLQVPEGVYYVEYLNPNSRFHLSMKLDYPNEFDRNMAELDGRESLGGDIFIHGNSVSTGCIAVGDIAIEELYALVEKMDGAPVKVIIAPYDFRREMPVIRVASTAPNWLPELYEVIEQEMKHYRKDIYGRQARAR
jgi:hypothetical protein